MSTSTPPASALEILRRAHAKHAVRPLRFGPDPNVMTEHERRQAIEDGNRLGALLRKILVEDRRMPLWFWEAA